MGARTCRHAVAGAVLLAVGAAAAAADEDELEVVEVIAPLGGADDADRLAGIQQATAAEIAKARTADLADFLRRNVASVFVNEAQGNPLQADVQYRGFVGSPLLGLPQGIAVYQDAARVNEPFGDTVNWALIPEAAVASATLVPGSNPLFGLNALGGALSIRTKDGASHPGTEVELLAGSFGRRSLAAQTGGVQGEALHYFAAASALREDGWRDFSPTDARQGFAKAGWRGQRARVDLSATLARTDLVGNGAAPVELLRQRRTAIFTRPDRTRNALSQWNLTLRFDPLENVAVDATAYFRASDIDSYNGDDSDFEACFDAPALLCEEDEPVRDADGRPVAADDALEGATVNRTRTEQDGLGFGVQADWLGALGGRDNRWVVGATFDAAAVGFVSSTELGALDATRLAIPGGVFVEGAFVGVDADTSNVALYASNTLTLLDGKLGISAAARYNRARVTLRDRRGAALDGDHEFRRLNPAVGAAYRLADDLALYANYGETNRAPSPVELTCADEDDPCRLPNAFLADPPLRQVVARTLEVGMRGVAGGVRWRGGWFQARNEDDILFISAGALTNQGYFANVGDTRRSGFELGLDGDGADERLRWFVRYTLLSATFETALTVPSANHPEAADGEIAVRPGSRLPLVPERLLKAGISSTIAGRLDLAAHVLHASRIHYRGDEANLARSIDGYAVLNLRADFAVSRRVTLFATLDNALDETYATFGTFGEADEVLGDDFEDSRFLTPAAPRAGWVGIELRL